VILRLTRDSRTSFDVGVASRRGQADLSPSDDVAQLTTVVLAVQAAKARTPSRAYLPLDIDTKTGQGSRPDPRPLCATIRGVKTLAVASTAERLAALEQQFIQIAKITKELRTHLDEVAETVRIAAEELGQHRLATSRSLALRSVPKRTATRPSGNSRTQKKRN
jgi:hypothetical protein